MSLRYFIAMVAMIIGVVFYSLSPAGVLFLGGTMIIGSMVSNMLMNAVFGDFNRA